MQMRDYQQLSSLAMYEACERQGSCLAEMATGLGKSLVAADLSARYDRVMISTPIKETMRQLAGTVKRYRRYSPEIEQADLWAEPGAPVTVACLQSLLSPVGLARLAQRAHMGVEAHGLFNAERGLPVSVFLNHAIAHIYSYLSGNREDDDLAAACWNLLYAIDSEVRHPELNDDLRGPGGALPEAARK